MGLERMTAVLQGTHDNYNIDHFKKIMSISSDLLKSPINDVTIASHRVIADHLRASSFLIAEGILPSNEGRGYVLRRIMRRGMRHAHTLGSKETIFHKLFEVLCQEMKKSYPELDRGKDLIVETLKNETVPKSDKHSIATRAKPATIAGLAEGKITLKKLSFDERPRFRLTSIKLFDC